MVFPPITFSLIGFVKKTFGNINRYFAAFHIRFVHHASNSTEMINVAMSMNYSRYFSFPSFSLANASPAAAVGGDINGSMIIQPVFPSIKVIFDRSNPRIWYMPSVTLNKPLILFISLSLQRLGLVVAGRCR